MDEHPLVTIHLNSRIKNVDGFVGNFHTTVQTGMTEEQLDHGVAILATGAGELATDEYLHGSHDRVVTLLELDSLFREKDEKVTGAGSVVFIQCVGSREPERPYCSKVCCTPFHKECAGFQRGQPRNQGGGGSTGTSAPTACARLFIKRPAGRG